MPDIIAPQFATNTTSYATLVSIYPFNVLEKKPGLIPNTYRIPASKDGDIQVVHLEDAKFPVYIDSMRGSIWVTTPALVLANSLLFDFVTSVHRYHAGDPENGIEPAYPGLFFLPGKLSKDEIKIKHKGEILRIQKTQRNWFEALVAEADDDWVRYQQHKMITDVQRFAARTLNIHRVWAIELKSENYKDCIACGNRIRATAIRCEHCQTVLNPEEFKKLSLATS